MLHAPPLGALLRQFAAGSALTCEPVDQGLLNRGYRLCTTRGRYFLKHHFDPETADPDAIARQHRATQRLADLGVPVAPPLTGRDGRTVAVVGGHTYALHPWIDGRHRNGGQLTTEQCARLGSLLGMVHASLEHVMPTQTRARVEGRAPAESSGTRAHGRRPDEPGADGVGGVVGVAAAHVPGPRPSTASPAHSTDRRASRTTAHHGDTRLSAPPARAQGDPVPPTPIPPAAGPPTPPPYASEPLTPDLRPLSADPADTFILIDELLARVRRHRPADSFDELARHRLLERRALLEQHADRRPPRGGSVGWVHGDFHPFNLLYKGDAPAAIVDWDRLGVKPRAEEAVRAAAIFFVLPVGTLDLPKVRAYARAYRRTAGATPSQLAAAVHRVWWERLNDFWMLRWHYERGDTRADPQFPAASALAVWWTREYDAVCAAFAD
ncbi:phosphotransferase [Streptomyces sp. NPDC050997]|uniref:phosphotransferase n=1 Tax=Streptomyces sp. NPDC050997 TaxID=3155519 RepID=UPI003425A3D5